MKKQTIIATNNIPAEQFLTLAQVKKSKEVVKINRGMTLYKPKAEALTVFDQVQYDEAAAFCKNVKTARGIIEKKRIFFVDPHRLVIKGFNDFFKSKILELDEIEQAIKKKMLKWYRAEQAIKEKQAEKIRIGNQKKIDDHLEKVAAEPEIIQEAPELKSAPAALPQTSKTEKARATVAKVWKWELDDISKVPREYLVISPLAVYKAVRAGVRAIPGIRQWQDDSLGVG